MACCWTRAGRGSVAQYSVEPNPGVTFKVRHEDADVLVVDKPAHLVTQPGKGHGADSLLNGLFARHGAELQNLGAGRDFGLLHRLDRETSGLLIVARRARAYDALRAAFESREVRKFYWALTAGRPNAPEGVIRRAILEHAARVDGKTNKLARVAATGKPAVTGYRVLEASVSASLVECRPVTGRLHQVRVHLASIGCPILGDEVYGSHESKRAGCRLALHAHRIVFRHPTSGEVVDVRSPWPNDLRGVLKRTGLHRPGRGVDGPGAGEPRGDNRGADAGEC